MIRFTKKGLEDLNKKYRKLKDSRPNAVLDLKKAREMGDLSENGYYKSAKSKLLSIDHELAKITFFLNHAKLINEKNKETIDIGCTVTLVNKNRKTKLTIVGDMEADPKNGKISLLSPVGKQVYGKKTGDEINIETPRKKVTYIIDNVNYPR